MSACITGCGWGGGPGSQTIVSGHLQDFTEDVNCAFEFLLKLTPLLDKADQRSKYDSPSPSTGRCSGLFPCSSVPDKPQGTVSFSLPLAGAGGSSLIAAECLRPSPLPPPSGTPKGLHPEGGRVPGRDP